MKKTYVEPAVEVEIMQLTDVILDSDAGFIQVPFPDDLYN